MPPDVLTLAGASILVGILVEVIKRTLAWDDSTIKRFVPLVSVVLGIVAVELLSAAQGRIVSVETFAGAAILGLFAGASSSGLYDNVQSIRGGA